jgi:hypothetical protein
MLFQLGNSFSEILFNGRPRKLHAVVEGVGGGATQSFTPKIGIGICPGS